MKKSKLVFLITIAALFLLVLPTAGLAQSCDISSGGPSVVNKTQSCISFSQNPVGAGGTSVITATTIIVVPNVPVPDGDLRIERAIIQDSTTKAFISYAACNPTLSAGTEASFLTFAEENPTDGTFTANADTSAVGTYGYRVHYLRREPSILPVATRSRTVSLLARTWL